MYAVIAIHYPKPEHIEDFLAFMAKVETVAHGSPGMLRFGSWREDDGKRLVGLSMWHEERSAEWSDRPDDVLFLAEP
jgi:heme-degrading monooxygenase HmoA